MKIGRALGLGLGWITCGLLVWPLPASAALAPEKQSPPVSLTASDGTGLQIVAFTARAVVEDPLAFTELRLIFRNPEPRAIEGRFEITLPPSAAVSRFAMRQSWGWQEGEVVELAEAHAAYEDFLHRRQDPALLEKQAGNQFQARVFPIPPSGEKELILSYSQELGRAEDPYRIPLVGLPRLDTLDIRVMVGKRELAARAASSLGGSVYSHQMVEVKKSGFVPVTDFEVPLPVAEGGLRSGLRHDNLVVARVAPVDGVAPDPVKGLIVLFDTSASRALGFGAEVARLGALVERLRRDGGAGLPLRVVCFDQEVVEVFHGKAGDFGDRQLNRIVDRRALGASDVGRALAWVAAQKPLDASRVLLVSDGIATAGKTEGNDLGKLGAGLRAAGVERLDALATGGIRDEALLKRLVTAGLPRDGVVVDGALSVDAIARRLGAGTFSGITVAVPGSKWVWPSRLDGVQPGDQVLVYADLPQGRAFEVVLGGARSTRQAAVLAEVSRPLLERAWVNARIHKLLDQRDTLAANDEDLRNALKKEIIDLSTRFRVLSDYTGFLVLETEQDYARFHIDRRALADILMVGAGGVELMNRREPIAPLPIQTPIAPPVEKNVAPLARDDTATRKKDSGDRREAGPAQPSTGMSASDPASSPLDNAWGSGQGAAASSPPPPSLRQGHHAINRSVSEPPAPRAAPPAEAARRSSASYDEAPRAALKAPKKEAKPEKPSANKLREEEPRVSQAEARRLREQEEQNRREMESRRRAEEEQRRMQVERERIVEEQRQRFPYEGKFLQAMVLIDSRKLDEARRLVESWRAEDPGDVLALIALGEIAEATGDKALAARAYGSLIDLFPSRADLRRFAGERLERLGAAGLDLAVDTYRQARAERPDHPASHRLLAYALVRAGQLAEAFDVILEGARHPYPADRFRGVDRILREDVGLIGAAWIRREPQKRQAILDRLTGAGAQLPTERSLRFVLVWETDANDVDFHIYDGHQGHAFYSTPALSSGGQLYADVTTGYGPECFTIPGVPIAYPYQLQAHYYRRGPMGYGMGKLEVLEHDGHGDLRFDERPFVVMVDQAFVNLGQVKGPLPAAH